MVFLFGIPIRCLNLSQIPNVSHILLPRKYVLTFIKVHHYKAADGEERHHHVTGEADEAFDLRSFPTLIEALQRVEEHAGFNVEIKYPMRLKVREGVGDGGNVKVIRKGRRREDKRIR